MSHNRVSPSPDHLEPAADQQEDRGGSGEHRGSATWAQTSGDIEQKSDSGTWEQTENGEEQTGSRILEQTGNENGQKTGSSTWEQTGNDSQKETLNVSEKQSYRTDSAFTNDTPSFPENSELYEKDNDKFQHEKLLVVHPDQQQHPGQQPPPGYQPQPGYQQYPGQQPSPGYEQNPGYQPHPEAGHGYQPTNKAKNHETIEMAAVPSTSNARGWSNHDTIIGGGEEGEGEIGCCGWILTILSIILVILTIPFSIFFCLKVVQEYERAVIFRLGRLLSGGAKGPGIFFILPCIESYTKVDLRTVSFDVPPQEILTRDSVTVSVDAVVYYRVSNPTVSVANVENAHHATRLLAQTTLRNILGTKNMAEILSERESISTAMQSVLDSATDRWGIKVERVEIKDVRLPLQLQRAMAAEAEASREARAKVLAAEGEHQASRALKEAADTMAESPAAIQLRYLQTLNSISAEKNSTIIFPLPIDVIRSFMSQTGKSNSKTSTIM